MSSKLISFADATNPQIHIVAKSYGFDEVPRFAPVIFGDVPWTPKLRAAMIAALQSLGLKSIDISNPRFLQGSNEPAVATDAVTVPNVKLHSGRVIRVKFRRLTGKVRCSSFGLDTLRVVPHGKGLFRVENTKRLDDGMLIASTADRAFHMGAGAWWW